MELMGKTIKCAVFDLDGTLLDTLIDLQTAVNFALSKHSKPPITLGEARRYVGNGVGKLVERSLKEGLRDPEYPEILADMRRYYAAHTVVKTKPYPGIPEALRKLRELGFKIAIVSNKPERAVRKLAKRFFPGLWDAALGDKAGRNRKPAPDAVWEALRQLGAKPGEAIYIGDSEVDMQTARNSGIPVMAVAWGFRDKADVAPYKPELYAEKTKDIAKLLKPLRAKLRIGVFGGSFDPIHKTHLAIAKRAKKQLGLDLTLFVPAYIAPHKRDKIYADNEVRCELISAALKKEPAFRLESCELTRGGVSYTVETLQTLKKRFAPCELYFLLGSDNYLGFGTWREPEKIKKLARLAVYQRKGETAKIKAEDILIKGPATDVSSTALRQKLKEGKIDKKDIPASVAKLIKSKKLYTGK